VDWNRLPARIGALARHGLLTGLVAIALAAPAAAGADEIADRIDEEPCYSCAQDAEILDRVDQESCYACHTADTDGDGLPDRDEIDLYGTSPTTRDTDGDSLSDDAEILRHGTNPIDPDSDHDGLPDATEVFLCNETCTDPWNPDSDGDGILDGEDWGN
jgi:hypothetical protein